MAKLDFVDTHVHFWDLKNPNIQYRWLEPGARHAALGEHLKRLKGKDYPVEQYLAETRASNVVAVVHVQAAVGTNDPVKETEWLQSLAGRTGFPQAIIAHADLKAPDVERVLERHCAFPNMRGIRDLSLGGSLGDPAAQRGFALLGKYKLIAVVNTTYPEYPKLLGLARGYPDVRVVLDHCGRPEKRTPEYFRGWKRGLETLAQAENVLCKISGLAEAPHIMTLESFRPWVLACIETFGPARCTFGSNFPVDRLFGTYDTLMDAYTQIVSGFTPAEQKAMFSGNAKKLYRM